MIENYLFQIIKGSIPKVKGMRMKECDKVTKGNGWHIIQIYLYHMTYENAL